MVNEVSKSGTSHRTLATEIYEVLLGTGFASTRFVVAQDSTSDYQLKTFFKNLNQISFTPYDEADL